MIVVVRIEPPLYLLTPLGIGEAKFLATPYGQDSHCYWHCFQLESKEAWDWPNPMVRLCESVSAMRDRAATPFVITDEYFEELRPHILRHKKSPLYERARKGNL
jgi:hypothetical protein